MFYVLTNQVNTKGHSYARALQQLTVGVYISEICLLGLFAINTAPGPIVLMAVFIAFTVIYHVIMHHALHPLTMYLPESYDGDDQLAMFATGENNSYDTTKSSLPPSESQNLTAQKSSSKKVSLFGRVFDPRKFKSHERVKDFISDHHSPPSYEDSVADMAYLDPVVTSEVPTLWVARDPMGISAHEIKDTSKILPMSDVHAMFNEKGKIVWDEDRVLEAPIWEKRIDY
jgi:hypothetical protein